MKPSDSEGRGYKHRPYLRWRTHNCSVTSHFLGRGNQHIVHLRWRMHKCSVSQLFCR